MPKPHYPPQGGPRPCTWANSNRGGPQRQDGSQPIDAQIGMKRARQDLPGSQYGGDGLGGHTPGGSLQMVWVALVVCGAGLLFGILAVLHHG